jgi:hypothetical protein
MAKIKTEIYSTGLAYLKGERKLKSNKKSDGRCLNIDKLLKNTKLYKHK